MSEKRQPQLKALPVAWLSPGQYQPRQHFSTQALEALSASIKAHGIIEPIIVRHINQNRYEIIAGERRWRAAQLAQLADVPCLIREDSDEIAALLALIENIQRVDLNPIEEASAYQQLLETFGCSAVDIADRVGKSRSEVTNKLGLLQLHQEVQLYMRAGQLTAGHAKVLVGLSPSTQCLLAKQAVKQGWSVRKMEQVARSHKQNSMPKTTKQGSDDPNLQALQQSLGEYLGLPVVLSTRSPSASGHRLVLDFHDLDVLEGFLEKIGFKQTVIN